MKRHFFSAFSVLLAIAAITPMASASDAQPSTFRKHHAALNRGVKQLNTIVPVGGGYPEPAAPRESIIHSSGSAGHNAISAIGDSTNTPITLYHTKQGVSAGHPEQYVNYKAWGGANWTAWLDSTGQFLHTQQGASSGHTDVVIAYISWDGSEWTATVDPVSKVFTHTRRDGSSSHTSNVLSYTGWDGAHWTMRLQ